MGYIKAHITTDSYASLHGRWDNSVVVEEGGFFTHAVKTVCKKGDQTEIILDDIRLEDGKSLQRRVVVNLPVNKVNILLEHLEIEGGVLDLLLHTQPENPKSVETPVLHRTGQGHSLTIDFNDLSDPGAPRHKRLLHPPPAVPPGKKPFRPFGEL